MAKIGTPYTSNFTGSEVDEAVEKAQTALTTADVQNTLGTATDKPISQNLFTETYQYGVKNYAIMPAPTYLLANVVALYSGVTQTGGFIQSHYYRCQESTIVQDIFEWKDITRNVMLDYQVVQEKGGSETNVMSQSAVTQELNILQNNIDSNTTARHTHSNKTILDAINTAFTTTLKAIYDGYASSISTNANAISAEVTNRQNEISRVEGLISASGTVVYVDGSAVATFNADEITAAMALFSNEAEVASGYTANGKIAKELKQIKARLTALEG